VATPTGDDPCLQVGVKIAELIIAATEDPTQKAAYEQDRTKLVKRFSDNCKRDNWPDVARTCFLGAKSTADIEACSRALPRPAPPGSGSAVETTGGSAGSGSAGSGSAKGSAGSGMKVDGR
jgi:hypothetical protein